MGQGAGGPANATTDFDQAIENLRFALMTAQKAAGLDAAAIMAARKHIGLAGVISGASGLKVAERLRIGAVTVTEDRVTTLAGALAGRNGTLAVIGTGSTLASQRNGVVRCLGGWGLWLGDQASGAWLGRALLDQVLLCHDGLAPHSALARDGLADVAGGPNGLVAFAAIARPADYATYAPRIIEAARVGDAVALALMQRGAAYLNRALIALDFGESDLLCLTGGVGPHYADDLARDIRDRISAPQGSALDGALRLAMKGEAG